MIKEFVPSTSWNMFCPADERKICECQIRRDSTRHCPRGVEFAWWLRPVWAEDKMLWISAVNEVANLLGEEIKDCRYVVSIFETH